MTTRLTCGARLVARGREKEAARVHGPRVGPGRGGEKGKGGACGLGRPAKDQKEGGVGVGPWLSSTQDSGGR